MGLPAILGDSNSGLLAGATTAARETIIAKAQDSNDLAPVLKLIGADSKPEPTLSASASPPASLPQSDSAAMQPSWFERNKKLIIIVGVVAVAAVAFGVVKLK